MIGHIEVNTDRAPIIAVTSCARSSPSTNFWEELRCTSKKVDWFDCFMSHCISSESWLATNSVQRNRQEASAYGVEFM